MACDTTSLLAGTAPLVQLPKGYRKAIIISLLAKWAGVSSDPASLLAGAAPCIACNIPPHLGKSIMIALLCQILGGVPAVTPAPTPPAVFSFFSISPLSVSHLVPVGVLNVVGAAFAAGMVIKLTKGGGSEFEAAVIDSSTTAHGTFVSTLNVGTADVSVILNGVTLTLPGALTIT